MDVQQQPGIQKYVVVLHDTQRQYGRLPSSMTDARMVVAPPKDGGTLLLRVSHPVEYENRDLG
ncbi:MAG: hypothetical protein AAFS10_24415, partial [Myxococcota bacterium]